MYPPLRQELFGPPKKQIIQPLGLRNFNSYLKNKMQTTGTIVMNQNAPKHLPGENPNQIKSHIAYSKWFGRENLHEAEVI